MGKVFFIKGNVPSSKNGKIRTQYGIISSKATRKWIKDTNQQFIDQKEEFLTVLNTLKRVYYIEFTFIRARADVWDYTNKGDTILDAMVKHGWIDDDNCYEVKPYYGDFRVDKNNPGVEIRILKNKPKHY